MDTRSSLERRAKRINTRSGWRSVHGWLPVLFVLLLASAGHHADAGDSPSGNILDILSQPLSETIEKITVQSSADLHYSIDETDLNNAQNPQLLIEVQNASLDKALGSGLGISVTVKRNGVLRIEAVESPQTRRVYLYVELSEPRSYREVSRSPAKRIELEIHPASGKGARIAVPGQSQGTGQASVGRESTAPAASQGSRESQNTIGTNRAQMRARPAMAAQSATATPSPVKAVASSTSGLPVHRIAHLYNLVYKMAEPTKLHITLELDLPVQPQLGRVAEGIQVLLPGTLLAFRNTTGGDWLKAQVLDVQQDAVEQIHIQQASINPEQVTVLIQEKRPTAYQLLADANPNRIVIEVDTQKNTPSFAGSSKKLEVSEGRIDGNTILLPVGQSLTLDMTLEPADTVVLGNPLTADAVPSAANSLIINGKQRGITNLEVRDRYNRLVTKYAIQVYEDWGWLEQELISELGEPIQVKVRNGTVFLEGSVESPAQAQQAEQLARAIVGDTGNVHSSLSIRSQSSEGVARRLESLLGAEGLTGVSVQVEGGHVILTGNVTRHTDLQRAENLARFFGDNVLNNIAVQLPDTLAQEIQSEIGLPNIEVQLANDSAVVRGVVHTAAERARVEQIAALYVPRVANLVEVQPAHPTSEEIQSLIGLPTVTASWSGDVLVLGGSVESQLEASMAEQIAKRFASSVVNNIRISRQDQVNIKVRVIEINKNSSSQLGIDWSRGIRFQEAFIPTGQLSELYRLGQAVRLDPITAQINALIEDGQAEILVDTNLTTSSGKVARLHSGGQLPLVSSITNGQNFGTVFGEEVREFGVQLEITPTVDDQGFINVEIKPQVSTLNEAQNVQTPMGSVPTFSSRSLECAVRLVDNQTYAVGGVMQRQEHISKTRVPVLGHIPLLGALFTSRRKTTQETELVFILTPTIVTPGMGNPSVDIPASPFPDKQNARFIEPSAIPAPTTHTQTVPSQQPTVSAGPQTVSEREPFEW